MNSCLLRTIITVSRLQYSYLCIPLQLRLAGYYQNKTYIQVKTFTKIYTRTGDKGNTSTFTGERRKKSDDVFEALGTIDELSSALGVAKEFIVDSNPKSTINNELKTIQCNLQDLAGAVATPKSTAKESHLKLTVFSPEHIEELERWIDSHSVALPELKNFILPSGGKSGAHLHLARTICRRAERRVVPLVVANEVDETVLKYLNRLSDYLFTVARVTSMEGGYSETIYQKVNPV